MAGGLVALFDDVAALARLAAASVDDVGAAAGRATTKAAGVLIDDAAVTPQYIQGVAAKRELPIIRRIAVGSLRNKLLFIVPAVLLLAYVDELLAERISGFPGILPVILMIGGGYLCYEAVHKIWGAISGHDHHGGEGEEPVSEDTLVAGAIRTDMILSAEIMVISQDAVTELFEADGGDSSFWILAISLVIVAVLITALVYGAVALIVKMDDLGLRLAQSDNEATASTGRGLVAAMPKVLSGISVLGIAAMLWVGGHIELVGLDDFGLSAPYDLVHGIEEAVRDATGGLGGFLAWVVNTIGSAILGLIVGGAVLLVVQRASGGGEDAHH